jgi:hypothetical protein
MLSTVYTCTDFPSHLPSILQHHPKTAALVLQLSPVATPADAKQRVAAAAATTAEDGGALHGTSQMSWPEAASDFITFYAVLLTSMSSAGEGEVSCLYLDPSWMIASGDPRVEEVCIVVGHESHVTLKWCSQLQHALSVTALLQSATNFDRREVGASSFSSFGVGGRDNSDFRLHGGARSGTTPGVSTLVVRLSPFVPPLQWDRHIDGIFGSQHCVCVSHCCCLAGKVLAEDEKGIASVTGDTAHGGSANGGATACALFSDGDDGDAAARVDAVAQVEATGLLRSDGAPPLRRLRRECIGSSVHGGCSLSLPFRVAAVLNGSAPLPQRPCPKRWMCVLCLVACDGCSLTAASSTTAFRSAQGIVTDAFDALCDFVGNEVIPNVKLDIVGGAWVCDESGRLLRDVCGVRGRLGGSYAAEMPNVSDTRVGQRVRNIILVLDFSTPLITALAGTPPTTFSAPYKLPSKERCCLASQIAAAVQETLGQLVAANLDIFSFPSIRNVNRDVANAFGADSSTMESNSLADNTSPAAHYTDEAAVLTTEMLCRSIAESVSRIVSLSTHRAFKDEVVRLLWGTDAADDAAAATGTRAAQTLPSTSAVQRRIEERLRATLREE